MKVLRMDSFDGAIFNREPWCWGVLRDLLNREDAAMIRSEIMRLDFHAVSADRSDKRYRMQLFEVGGDTAGDTRLADLLGDIQCDAYISALERYADADLLGKRGTINIWKYSKEDFLSPHVDKPEKYLTQLFYFSEEWPPTYGGSLNVLADSDEASVVASIVPQYRNSAVIKTTELSWHSVSPVSAEGAERCCLQYTFWND